MIEERVIAPIAAAVGADPALSGKPVVVACDGETVAAGALAVRIE